jgi:hypothetical protein
VSVAQPAAAGERTGLGGRIERHLGGERVARVTYGAIIGMALIVVLEKHPPRSAVVVGTLMATALAVALAELYSEVIGHQTRHRERVQAHHLRRLTGDVAAVAFGIAFPAVFFLADLAGLLKEDTAFTLAKWSGLVLIGFYGFCAARLAGEKFLPALLQALAVAAVGAMLIAFKAVVH